MGKKLAWKKQKSKYKQQPCGFMEVVCSSSDYSPSDPARLLPYFCWAKLIASCLMSSSFLKHKGGSGKHPLSSQQDFI